MPDKNKESLSAGRGVIPPRQAPPYGRYTPSWRVSVPDGGAATLPDEEEEEEEQEEEEGSKPILNTVQISKLLH